MKTSKDFKSKLWSLRDIKVEYRNLRLLEKNYSRCKAKKYWLKYIAVTKIIKINE